MKSYSARDSYLTKEFEAKQLPPMTLRKILNRLKICFVGMVYIGKVGVRL